MKIIACIVNSPIFAGNEWFIMDIFVTLHRFLQIPSVMGN